LIPGITVAGVKGLEVLWQPFVVGVTPAATLETLVSASACVDSLDDVSESTMWPRENVAIAHAVDERRREFATVRWCARRALSRLGLPPAELLPDAEGVPRWPAGVVGSMTHCPGYRAAIVARSERLAGLGLDAEVHAALPGVADELVLCGDERAQVRELADAHPQIHWDRIVFCAKEAVFKALYPSTRQWLDFDDISMTVEPDGTFQARDAHGHDLTGYWLVDRGLVVTVTAVAS
jgi:4'-phosphopantetheinyl transferase EntD